MGFGSLRHHIALLFLSMLLVCPTIGASTATPTAADGSVTLRISRADLPKLSNIQVIKRVDYGAFSVIEVPKSTIETLKSAKARIQQEGSADVVGLQGHEFDVHAASTLPSQLTTTNAPGTPMLHLLHLNGPTKRDWISGIEAAGGKIVSYIPENTYLVWIDPARLAKLDRVGFVSWKGIYQPGLKISKELDGATGRIDYLSVVIYGDSAGLTVNRIKAMGATLVRTTGSPFGPTVPASTAVFSADASLVAKIAQLPRVIRVDKTSLSAGVDEEVANQILIGHRLGGIPYANPSYRSWLQQTGFDGSGSIVAVVDTGCDTNNPSTMHGDLYGQLSAPVKTYDPSPPTDASGHGTHVAGIIAGTGAKGIADDEGFLYGLGVAPGCKLFVQNAAASLIFPPLLGWNALTQDSIAAGAFVSNNSWYSDANPGRGYTATCSTFDALVRDGDPESQTVVQPLVMVFSAGNAGSGMSTMLEPKEAKNIISVGASEDYHPESPLNGSCAPSGDITGIAGFSSRGPCIDGRMAPTLVAPGTSVASTASYTASYTGDPCKAMVAQASPHYAWMSGTSMSAPMVSGSVALLGQWWRSTHGGSNPSPAMCKALLINGADDIAGGPDGRGGLLDHIPNGDQGWGRLNIASSINPPNASYDDQTYIFTETGQSRQYSVYPVDPTKPLKITLVWSDAPGSVGSHAWVNDLDLEVTGQSGTYLGNVFQSGWSTVGGSRDSKNNVECVYIAQPSGGYVVTVLAANVAGDGIPGNSSTLDQDYAIVIRNGSADTTPPSVPVVTPSKPYTTDLTRLSASWTASDAESGISKYEYAIGTTSGATDVVGWTDAGVETGATAQGLTLAQGQNYYFTVRATNGVGLTSQASADPILAAQPVTDIAAAKALADTATIALSSKVITAAFDGRFYISEEDRYSGIGVIWPQTVTEGSPVTVIGKLTTADGERLIEAIDVEPALP